LPTFGGGREAPAHLDQLTLAVAHPDHWRHLIGEDPGQERHVAGVSRLAAKAFAMEAWVAKLL
jgi:hypothetical protein